MGTQFLYVDLTVGWLILWSQKHNNGSVLSPRRMTFITVNIDPSVLHGAICDGEVLYYQTASEFFLIFTFNYFYTVFGESHNY